MRKILIADDSRLSRAMTRRLLSQFNVEVVEASSGEEAIQVYEQTKPDAVILDLMMPGISGQETLKRLRQIDPNARVIIMSADSQDSSVQEVLNTGAVYFVPKPPDADQLAEVLEQSLGIEL